MRFQILLSGVLAGLAVAHVVQRDGTCAPQALGSGPVASPDTPEAFLGNPELQVTSQYLTLQYEIIDIY